MKTQIVVVVIATLIAGCADRPLTTSSSKATESRKADKAGNALGTSGASTYDAYKRDLAQRISQINSSKVYRGHPQALLRSVVVMKYVVDAQGNLVKSELLRSNHDGETEKTALNTLRNSAPFPRPASHLLRHGRIEISETWLFNNDGRFQLRTIAEPQMDS